jgi:hypothetical protein
MRLCHEMAKQYNPGPQLWVYCQDENALKKGIRNWLATPYQKAKTELPVSGSPFRAHFPPPQPRAEALGLFCLAISWQRRPLQSVNRLDFGEFSSRYINLVSPEQVSCFILLNEIIDFI